MLIRKIELGLENCEVITIDGKYIGDFHTGDIKKEISRMACNWIDERNICGSFYIEIHKDADNKEYAPFGNEKWKTTIFQRLMECNDICDITIYLYDQYEEDTCNDESQDIVHHYYVDWGGDSDYVNAFQTSKIAKTGWLYITIGENMKMEDVFPDEIVDEDDYAEFQSNMFHIGDKGWAELEAIMNEAEENVKPTTRTIKVTAVYDLDDPELKYCPITPKNEVEKMVMREMEEFFSEDEGFLGVAVTVIDE